MTSFFEALSTNPLLSSALIAGVLVSIISGIIGSYVVVKRIVFISGSISHAVLGGLGFFLWLERTQEIAIHPIFGSLIAAVASALLIGMIHLHLKQREDAVIAAVWSIGMAVGIIFISNTPGYNLDLTNFLIGNILWVSPSDLQVVAVLDLFVAFLCYLFHHQFMAICFDESEARLRGLRVDALYLLLLVLTAVSIVLLIQIVGIVLVMTMLTIPASIANLFTNRLSTMMFISMLLSIFFCTLGMMISYHLDWPAGATIAMSAGSAYALCLLKKR